MGLFDAGVSPVRIATADRIAHVGTTARGGIGTARAAQTRSRRIRSSNAASSAADSDRGSIRFVICIFAVRGVPERPIRPSPGPEIRPRAGLGSPERPLWPSPGPGGRANIPITAPPPGVRRRLEKPNAFLTVLTIAIGASAP